MQDLPYAGASLRLAPRQSRSPPSVGQTATSQILALAHGTAIAVALTIKQLGLAVVLRRLRLQALAGPF